MATAPGGDQPKKGSLFGGLFGKKDKHAEPEKVMEISGPTGFQRGIHIDHNKDDGTFSVPYPLAGPAIAQPKRVALWAGTKCTFHVRLHLVQGVPSEWSAHLPTPVQYVVDTSGLPAHIRPSGTRFAPPLGAFALF
jgi:hypothetical protein